MATSPTSSKRPSRRSADPEQLTPWQRFYRRYSPHGEMPRSSLASIGLHLLLVFILILMSGALVPKDHTQVATDVVRVGNDESAAAGEGDDGLEAAGDAMEATEPADSLSESQMPETEPSEAVQTEVSADVPTETNAPTAEELLAETEGATKRTAAAAQRASAAMQRAKEKLKQNMSKGAGSGAGGGGSGATGRAARPARWILKFNAGSARDYLAQYEGLGAKIAFPTTGDKYRYFSNLTSSPPSSEVRDLSGEGRLYWVDEDPASAARVAQALGTTPTDFFLAFLPLELEERMLKLELDAAGVPEDQIASTHFVVIPRGGNYEVQVLKQVLK